MERYEQPLALVQNIDDLARLSKQVADSNYYGDMKSAAQAGVKLMIARELGLGVTAISNIHLVEGKIQLGYQILIALVKRSGKYNMRFLERTDELVRIEWFEDGESVGFSKFDMKDAERAGLTKPSRSGNPSNFTKYPIRMLTARAVSDGFSTYAPECAGGALYTDFEISGDEPAAAPAPRPIATARTFEPAPSEEVVDAEVVPDAPAGKEAAEDAYTSEPVSGTTPTERVKSMLASLTTEERDAVKLACATLNLKATPRGILDAFDEHAFEHDSFLVAISNAINDHAQAERESQEGLAEARTAEQSDEDKSKAGEFDTFLADSEKRWGGQSQLKAAGNYGK